jgi:starch phosphorylase
MGNETSVAPSRMPSTPEKELLEQYGCGRIHFTGTGDALYKHHLMFDSVVDAAAVGPRERYEAAAHAVRDIAALAAHGADVRASNPERIYHLSMEFLIGCEAVPGPVAKGDRRSGR